MANSRKSFPMMPPMKQNRNEDTAIVDVLIDSTVKPISFEPFMAAS